MTMEMTDHGMRKDMDQESREHTLYQRIFSEVAAQMTESDSANR